MSKKFIALMILAVVIGYLSASDSNGLLIGLVRTLGPLAVVGLLVADHYENKKPR